MWVRKRLDIRWSDLGSALRDCLTRWNRGALADDLEDLWSPVGDALPCLSVRSGFDLWLQALQLPPGSEVLVSAITIRDMVRIVEAHGLVAVPVDVNPEDLSVNVESLRRAVSEKTRAILIAHLFGTRQPLAPVLEIARQHNLLIAEDCAQAFAGRHFTGHAEADITMFSFGSIKTATALGGGLVRVRDAKTLNEMRQLQARYPVQRRGTYAKKVLKHSAMKLLSYGPPFSGVVATMRLAGRDPDQVVASLARAFPGADLLPMIRRQPSAALMAVMYRRIGFYHRRTLNRRSEKGRRLMALLRGSLRMPGWRSEVHNFWVFPVLHREPARLVRRLLNAGFDAAGAHSLFVVPAPADRPELRAAKAEEMLPQIVHLPCYPEMPDRELRRMADAVRGTMRQTAEVSARGLTGALADSGR